MDGSQLDVKARAMLERVLDEALVPDADTDAIERGLRAAETLVANGMVGSWQGESPGSPEVRLHVRLGSAATVASIVDAALDRVTDRFGVVRPPFDEQVDNSLGDGVVQLLLDDLVLVTSAEERWIEQAIMSVLPQLLTREETTELLNRAREHSPMVVQELVPNMLAIGQLRQVLQSLLAEQVPITRMTTILNTLADNAVYTKDPHALAEHVRTALGRTVYAHLLDEDDTLRAFMFSPGAERAIQDAIQLNERGVVLKLDPFVREAITNNLVEALDQHRDSLPATIVVVPPKLRRHVHAMLDRTFNGIVVLSYAEIQPGLQIDNLAIIEAHRPGQDPPDGSTGERTIVDLADAQDWNW